MANEYLKETWQQYIWRMTSTTQTIQRSRVFQNWFEAAIARAESAEWLAVPIRN
jgi:hypothetical protein